MATTLRMPRVRSQAGSIAHSLGKKNYEEREWGVMLMYLNLYAHRANTRPATRAVRCRLNKAVNSPVQPCQLEQHQKQFWHEETALRCQESHLLIICGLFACLSGMRGWLHVPPMTLVVTVDE